MNPEPVNNQSKESPLPPRISPSVTFVLNYVNTSIKVTNTFNLSIQQGLCFICLRSLKGSFINIKNPKKKCYYCNRAVCASCAGIKLIPKFETKKHRICVACFNITVGKYFKQLILAKTVKCFNVEEEFERENDLKKISGLKENIRAKEREINKKAQEIEDIKQKIVSYEQENEQIIGRDLESIQNTFRKLELESGLMDDEEISKVNQVKSLKDQALDKENYVKAMEKQKEEPDEVIQGSDSEVINLLRDQVHYLKVMKKVYQQNTYNLNFRQENANENSCSMF